MSIYKIDKNPTAEGRRILSILEDMPFTEQDILKDDNGRPYFSDRTKGVDFNISHSKDLVAVSHVKGIGFRTGCDVQVVRNRTNTQKIAEQYFSNLEAEYILSQKEKGNDSAFFEIWTLKECYIKLRGLSVFDIAKAPCFYYRNRDSVEFGSSTAGAVPLLFYLYKLNNNDGTKYIMAAAVEGETAFGRLELQPLIQWFSETLLSCELIDKFHIYNDNKI